jgi:lipid-binding SYLF domain-containing protein
MKRFVAVGAMILVGFALATPIQAQDEDKVQEVEDVIATFVEKDPEMQKWFDTSYGYAVFPNVGKGGLGIGAAHGNGLVYQGGTVVGKTELKEVTIGLQAGGQSFVEVIFFKDKTAFDDFTRGNYEFGAQVSAVALTAGASADLAYNGGVAVMTMAKGGLMYEASVGGQKFEYEAFGG